MSNVPIHPQAKEILEEIKEDLTNRRSQAHTL